MHRLSEHGTRNVKLSCTQHVNNAKPKTFLHATFFDPFISSQRPPATHQDRKIPQTNTPVLKPRYTNVIDVWRVYWIASADSVLVSVCVCVCSEVFLQVKSHLKKKKTTSASFAHWFHSLVIYDCFGNWQFCLHRSVARPGAWFLSPVTNLFPWWFWFCLDCGSIPCLAWVALGMVGLSWQLVEAQHLALAK